MKNASPLSRLLRLIPYASGWGARRRDTEQAPDALRQWRLAEKLSAHGVAAEWLPQAARLLSKGEIFAPQQHYTPQEQADADIRFTVIGRQCHFLCEQVKQTLAAGEFPVTLGGDHTMGVGTWSGVVEALDAHGKFGLVWMDAHMDAHTPETTPSGNPHGMPLAALMGFGRKELTHVGSPKPKLSPRHVMVVGARQYEAEEEAFLKQHGARIFYQEEVRSKGLAAVWAEIYAYFQTQDLVGFGVSVDIDFIDPEDAPGTGAPWPGGPRKGELVDALRIIGGNPAFKAFEIAEYNPVLDHSDRRTLALVFDALMATFAHGQGQVLPGRGQA